MCCTFGDQTDTQWYKKYNLEYKVAISDDGKISKEAEKALLARIKEGKAKDFINPMGEVKRQFRCKLGPAEGKKIADAIDKLW